MPIHTIDFILRLKGSAGIWAEGEATVSLPDGPPPVITPIELEPIPQPDTTPGPDPTPNPGPEPEPAAPVNSSPDLPARVESFGPNGTHWPSLVPTPFLYSQAANEFVVDPNWDDIEATLMQVTDAQANAGVRILVRAGTLAGNGSSGPSVINTAGNPAWEKRVTICPQDGYGTVTMTGGQRFRRAHNICLAGFIDMGGTEFEGCDRSAVAWIKSPYMKTISEINDITMMEFCELVVPDAAVANGDVSQVGAQNFTVSNFLWDGCYLAPHYYVDNTLPRPHTDTLQFYRANATYADWDMTIRDTAIYGSNNAALQTGGADGLDLIHCYIVNSSVSLDRYPVPAGGETDELDSAINGAGQNWTATDTLVFGGMALSNPGGNFSPQPFVTVTNSTTSQGPSQLATPQNGSWTVNSATSFYLDAAPPYPTDEYLESIWYRDVSTSPEPDPTPDPEPEPDPQPDPDPEPTTASGRYRAAVMASGPAGYWRLQDEADLVAADETGQAEGFYSSTDRLVGPFGEPALQTGTHHVDAPFALDAFAEMTVEMLILATDRGAPSQTAFAFGIDSSTKISAHLPWAGSLFWDSGPATTQRLTAKAPSEGVWHHVALTTGGNNQRIYVNGVLLAQRGSSTNNPAKSTLRIGGEPWADSKHQGGIADFAVYRRVLGAQEIADHYAAAELQ